MIETMALYMGVNDPVNDIHLEGILKDPRKTSQKVMKLAEVSDKDRLHNSLTNLEQKAASLTSKNDARGAIVAETIEQYRSYLTSMPNNQAFKADTDQDRQAFNNVYRPGAVLAAAPPGPASATDKPNPSANNYEEIAETPSQKPANNNYEEITDTNSNEKENQPSLTASQEREVSKRSELQNRYKKHSAAPVAAQTSADIKSSTEQTKNTESAPILEEAETRSNYRGP